MIAVQEDRCCGTVARSGRAGSLHRWAVGGVLVATLLFSALLSAPAASARDGTVDFSWIAIPTNFVELRSLREELKLPPLLVETCDPDIPRDAPGTFGEDYMTGLVAEVALLRMLATDAGDAIVRQFFSQSSEPSTVLGVYRQCITNLVPGWDNPPPWFSFFRTTVPGWLDVKDKLWRVPPFSEAPGTNGDWDISAAVLLRAWELAQNDLAGVLPKPDFDALQAHVSEAIWLQGGPVPEDEAVVPGLVPETENHQLMIETTRLLHNELPPLANLTKNGSSSVRMYDANTNADNTTNGLVARLKLWFNIWAQHDFLEYNARAYSRYQLLSLLNVYDFASDVSLRRAAGVVLDLLAAKVAAESMNDNRTAPFRRRAENEDAKLIGSDQLSDAFQVWMGNMAPTGQPLAFANDHAMVLAATSSYRPPDVLADLVLDPSHHDYLQTFDGQGQGEAAFGARDFTIAGGGVGTRCPYPDHFASLEKTAVELSVPVPGLNIWLGNKAGDECKGSGNDPGVVQPIVLLPRRVERTPTSDSPTFDDVIHSGGDTSSACIGVGVACARTFIVGGRQPRPNCRIERDLPGGDAITALRYAEPCVGADYRGLCFFVFIRSMKTKTHPFSYLVTHLCDPASPEGEQRKLFQSFSEFLTDGDGAPTRPSGCSTEEGDQIGPFGFAPTPQWCSYSISFTPPEQYGPIRSAQRVVMNDTLDALYTLTPSPLSAGVSGSGSIVQLSAGIPRLRVSDDASGEWVVEPIAGGGVSDSAADRRPFGLSVHINSPFGVLTGQITGVQYPDAVRTVSVSAIDETQLQHDCTVTLPNGKQGCYAPNVFCGDPPVPCTTGAAQPVNFPPTTFPYGGSPAATSQPIGFAGGVPSVDSSHTYVVEVCLTWYRFYTSADYRNDPSGTANDDAHETCEPESVQPKPCLNPLLCGTSFVPLTQQFPSLTNGRYGRPTETIPLKP